MYTNETLSHNIDNNNNKIPGHTMETGIKYDCGLGIVSTRRQDISVSRSPKKNIEDKVDNYSTINIPVPQIDSARHEKKWTSMCANNDPSPRKSNPSEDGIIEFKTVDSKNNVSTSIVIYRNSNHELRHINIIDYRSEFVNPNKVHRSNTLSYDRAKVPPHEETSHSTDDLTRGPINHSTNDLCHGLSLVNSVSDQTVHSSCTDFETKDARKKTSSSKILQKLALSLCCGKCVNENVTPETEMESNCFFPHWKFCLDEFGDLKYLSSGTQGTIYTTELEDTTVVLKKIRETVRKEVINIEHLLDLKHKNVIRFIGIIEEPDSYLVMEYCSQGQLFERLRLSVAISPADVHSWSHQICDGMVYLHHNEVIHRDLKSPNILLSGNNILKIIDFEFSKDSCESKLLNSFVGTIAWMAPEVLREEIYTKNVDVWSYGVVIWEMVTREIPYCEIERTAVLYGVGNNFLSLPLCTSFPEDIQDLLLRCWEQDSEKRPSFQNIFECFGDYFDNLKQYSQEEFTSLQLEWKEEIKDKLQEMKKEKVSTFRIEAELIRRRTQELDDAKNIKKLYNEKLKRADNLIDMLTKSLDVVDNEIKKNEREWKFIQKLKESHSPNNTLKKSEDRFLSLPFCNGNKNRRQNKTASNLRIRRKDSGKKQHSMIEQSKCGIIKRKFSCHSFKERNHNQTSKLKNASIDTSKNHSTNLKTATSDNRGPLSLNIRNGNKYSDNQWKRNSSPCDNVKVTALQSPKRTDFKANDLAGAVNQSFQGSTESFGSLGELQKVNQNVRQIAYFGTNASISDVNNCQENISINFNTAQLPSTFHHRLMEESISECTHNEESQSSCDSQEHYTNNPVIIRETSGRTKLNTRIKSSESQGVSMTTLNGKNQNSLKEKEATVKDLIRPHGFLAGMNVDLSMETNTVYNNNDRVQKALGKRNVEN